MTMTPDAPHILLLEDDPMHQRIIAFNLTHAGFKVTAAAESTSALTLVENIHFDLVITDYHLPDYLGTDFINVLREDEDHRHVPVILLTAWKTQLDGQYLRNRLSVLLMSKSCTMAKLVETVSKLLAMAQSASC